MFVVFREQLLTIAMCAVSIEHGSSQRFSEQDPLACADGFIGYAFMESVH